MKYLKFKIIIIVFLSIFIISFNTPMFLNDNDNTLIRDLNSSGSWNLSPLIIDDSGSGDYTWSQAVLQPWCSGSGTINNPYVIENITIDAVDSGNGLIVRNSNVYFIIFNSSFLNAGPATSDAGIRLINTNHGQIINNYLYHNQVGIKLDNSRYNLLEENNFKISHIIAIDMGQNCDFNEIFDNDINNNYRGMTFVDCDNNMIKGNEISFTTRTGIACWNSNYNLFFNNTINFAGNIGFGFDGDCTNNIIDSNSLSYNDHGIWLCHENYHNIYSNNNISNNVIHGILMESIDNRFNTFHSNSISANGQYGIIITSTSTSNLIYNNSFISNGLHVLDSSSGTFFNNSQIGNYWDNYTGSDFNDDGIGDFPHNISLSPLIEDFLPIWDDGDDITPPELTIVTPSEHQVIGHKSPEFVISTKSLYIDSIWYNVNNSVVNYTITGFIGDINQDEWDNLDEGLITITFYANDSLGNTGFVDIEIEKDITFPILVINSPKDGDVFSSEAPSFNITVIEKNFLSSWYSLDGGVTNFSISGYIGSINQTAWNNAPSGNIVITFYAKDKAGNIAYKETTVTKSIPSTAIPGYNLALLITFIGITSVVLFLSTIKKRKIKNFP